MTSKIGFVIHPEELDDTWAEILPDLGVSVLGIHPVGGVEAHISMERLIRQVKDPAFQKRVTALEALGVSVEYECHALSYLLPRDLIHLNPEWFRMNKEGCRTADSNCCPSNIEALEAISTACEKLAVDLPTANHRYHLWADDIPDGGCHCERCQSMTRSDQALTIVHAMLNGLKRTDPAAKLSYLAYDETMNAPQLKPHPDVFLEYAPMTRDFHLPLHTPDCEKNMRQFRPLAGLLETFGTKDATALDYWMDNSLFSGWKKPPKQLEPDLVVASADAESYRLAGIEYITTFACYLGADYRELWGDPPIEPFVRSVESK